MSKSEIIGVRIDPKFKEFLIKESEEKKISLSCLLERSLHETYWYYDLIGDETNGK